MVVNLRSAIDNGYEVKKITAYDNFPMTRHVEVVTLITQAE
jgi:tRNA/tmRNA/rRNA uracil-C5-methylase (TrmA/RlmC/RlmD family)